jgi:hypothetical protein
VTFARPARRGLRKRREGFRVVQRRWHLSRLEVGNLQPVRFALWMFEPDLLIDLPRLQSGTSHFRGRRRQIPPAGSAAATGSAGFVARRTGRVEAVLLLTGWTTSIEQTAHSAAGLALRETGIHCLFD